MGQSKKRSKKQEKRKDRERVDVKKVRGEKS